jgi:hypothetical protein
MMGTRCEEPGENEGHKNPGAMGSGCEECKVDASELAA